MTNPCRHHLVRTIVVAGSALFLNGGYAQTTRATQSGTISATLPQSLRLPVGLSLKVRLKDSLNSRIVTPGIIWNGVLAEDLVSPQGRVYAVAGTPVTGVVASVRPAANDQPASISLRAVSINGVELYTTDKTRDGAAFGQDGALRSNPVVAGPIGGFVTSNANQQVNLTAGTLLTFNTSVP